MISPICLTVRPTWAFSLVPSTTNIIFSPRDARNRLVMDPIAAYFSVV
jgi:hypothetical protein